MKTQGYPGKLCGSHSLKAWGYRLGKMKGEYAEKAGEGFQGGARQGLGRTLGGSCKADPWAGSLDLKKKRGQCQGHAFRLPRSVPAGCPRIASGALEKSLRINYIAR